MIFLVISDLPEQELSNEKMLKSSFGMFGPLHTVKLLDEHLKSAMVTFLFRILMIEFLREAGKEE